MNLDPVHHTHDPIPPTDHEILAAQESSAASSMMISIIAVIVAVALIAVVIAWSPWTSGGGRNVTPGQGGQDQPLPTQREPDQQRPAQPGVLPTTRPQISPR